MKSKYLGTLIGRVSNSLNFSRTWRGWLLNFLGEGVVILPSGEEILGKPGPIFPLGDTMHLGNVTEYLSIKYLSLSIFCF